MRPASQVNLRLFTGPVLARSWLWRASQGPDFSPHHLLVAESKLDPPVDELVSEDLAMPSLLNSEHFNGRGPLLSLDPPDPISNHRSFEN